VPLIVGGSGIATIDQLKAYLDITKTTQDALLQSLLDSATALVARYTGRHFLPTPALVNGADTAPPVALQIPTYGESTVAVPDVREVDAATLDGLVVPDWTLIGTPATRMILPPPASVPGYPPAPKSKWLTLTGRFGFLAPPADLVDAVLLMCARRYRERDAAYGDSVQLGDGGVVSYFKQLPPHAQMVLDGYRVAAIG